MATMGIAAIAALVVGLGLGALLGRRSGPNAERVRQLESEGEARRKETERLQSELSAARQELEEGRREQERYRERVAEHFSGTSDVLRELTLQYRAVFSHLSKGAAELCPDRFEEIDRGLGLGALAPGGEDGAKGEGAGARQEPARGAPTDDAAGERRTGGGSGPGEGGSAA